MPSWIHLRLESLPLRTLELLRRPFPQVVSEHNRVQACSRWLLRVSRLKRWPMPSNAGGRFGAHECLSGAQGGDAAEPDIASSAAGALRTARARTASVDLGAAIGHGWQGPSRATGAARLDDATNEPSGGRSRLPERPNCEHAGRRWRGCQCVVGRGARWSNAGNDMAS